MTDLLFSRRDGMLEAGTLAPEFEGQDQNGKSVRLSALRGRNVVLWFFPKANTPG